VVKCLLQAVDCLMFLSIHSIYFYEHAQNFNSILFKICGYLNNFLEDNGLITLPLTYRKVASCEVYFLSCQMWTTIVIM
jgi:hypothetical protein